MTNHSIIMNWNSPDYFKLFDDFGNYNGMNELNAVNHYANENNNFNKNNGNNPTNIIGSNNNGTVISTSPPSTQQIYPFNQSFQYQYDYISDTPTNNTGIKANYETGSNFMLLMEDFNAYFYNYNGSVGVGIGTTGSTNINQTGFELQTNCSIANSTCNETIGEFSFHFYFKPFTRISLLIDLFFLFFSLNEIQLFKNITIGH